MKSHISRIIVLLMLIAIAGCATGPSTGRNIKIGDMLPGHYCPE